MPNQPYSQDSAGKKLTRKQKVFADYLIDHPKSSAKEAIQVAYNVQTDRSAEVMASENLRKPEIRAYMESHAQIAQDTVMEVIEVSRGFMSQGGKEGAAYASVALNGSKDILDRIYGKPKQTTEVTSSVLSISVDLTGGAAGEIPAHVLKQLEQ